MASTNFPAAAPQSAPNSPQGQPLEGAPSYTFLASNEQQQAPADQSDQKAMLVNLLIAAFCASCAVPAPLL